MAESAEARDAPAAEGPASEEAVLAQLSVHNASLGALDHWLRKKVTLEQKKRQAVRRNVKKIMFAVKDLSKQWMQSSSSTGGMLICHFCRGIILSSCLRRVVLR